MHPERWVFANTPFSHGGSRNLPDSLALIYAMARSQQQPIVENTVPVTEDAEEEDDVAIEGEEQVEEGYG